MSNEYRVDIKVRNNLILSRIEKAGYRSIPEFCRAENVPYHGLINIINMTLPVLRKDGKWQKTALKAADALQCSPENLFSEAQMNAVLKSNKRSVQVNEAEMKFMLEVDENKKLPEQLYLEGQRNTAIENVLKLLTPREQKVIEMRFGLGEYMTDHTLDQVGEHLGISGNRIRQIEQKALRKLRSPHRSELLSEFVEVE